MITQKTIKPAILRLDISDSFKLALLEIILRSDKQGLFKIADLKFGATEQPFILSQLQKEGILYLYADYGMVVEPVARFRGEATHPSPDWSQEGAQDAIYRRLGRKCKYCRRVIRDLEASIIRTPTVHIDDVFLSHPTCSQAPQSRSGTDKYHRWTDLLEESFSGKILPSRWRGVAKKLEEVHGPETALRSWETYLKGINDPKYLSIDAFARDFKLYLTEKTQFTIQHT